MYGTGIATSTITGLLDNLGSQSVAAAVYTTETFWGYMILAVVIGFLIGLGKNLLHIR